MPHCIPVPPLPEGWPYPSRGAGHPLERTSGAALGPGWTVFTRGTVPLQGTPEPLAGAFGRGGILRCGEAVIRPYRRGGWVRHVNERLYLSSRRFAQEEAVHHALWSEGFPTVEPLGYGFRRRAWGIEGIFLTRFVEARPWPSCWDRSRDVVPQVAVLLEALTAWGLQAPDLNATNILLTSDGRVLALDWDRARWTRGRDLRTRYRARLLRSLRKLQAPEDVIDSVVRSLAG